MADGKNERERQEKKREVSERGRMGKVELVKGMERWREEREREREIVGGEEARLVQPC